MKIYLKSALRVFSSSRQNGTANKYSDLDLAIVSDHPLDFSICFKLIDAFQESELSFRVDLHVWHQLSP